ncbi:hypothetical protein PGTUg99_036914 [Puccinia graminis f. sp. tritici]|uniref:No apical meristem-associated C-terminal domain-containing protein n=1 Tax=Puccinia graminis f. sp. tritici TaxID=56615 RepID=A0A5B0RQ08_PUCGR|nr:hypothetical protein PGTUg99_036914 [Puccinia graminis f. sp. tritici]
MKVKGKTQAPSTTATKKTTEKKTKTTTTKESPRDPGEPKAPRTRYQENEDVQICLSWLEVSQDPLNSTNQTANTFWNRVAKHFSKSIGSDNQTGSSIKSCWQVLQQRINKFCGCVKQIEHSNQSGTSAEDRLSSALKLYIALSQQPDLKKKSEPKIPSSSVESGISLIDDNRPALSLSSDAYNDPANSDASTIQSHKTSHPIGNRKAKDLAQKAREDKKFKDDIITIHKEIAGTSQAQNKILSEQKDTMATLDGNTIMQVDISTISEASRPFYKWQQRKVLDGVKREQAKYEKKLKEEEENKKKKEIEDAKKKKDEEKKKKDKEKKKKEKGKQSEQEEEEEEDEDEEEEEEVE